MSPRAQERVPPESGRRVLLGAAAALLLAACAQDGPAPRDPVTQPPAPVVTAGERDGRADTEAPGTGPSDSGPAPDVLPSNVPVVVEVRDPEGSPAVDALVRVLPRFVPDRSSWTLGSRFLPATEAEEPAAEGRTGPSGRAAFAGIPVGRWCVVIDSPGAARAEVEFAIARGDAPAGIPVALERERKIVAVARDGEGRSVGGVEIVVAEAGTRFGPAPWRRTWRATTGPDGRCRIGGLPAGMREVWAITEWGAVAGGDAVRIPGVDRVDLLIHEPGVLRGRVLDAAGVGVAGATVEFLNSWESFRERAVARGRSAADGLYAARSLDPGVRVDRVRCRAPGFAPLDERVPEVVLQPGAEHGGPDLRLAPESRVSGRVLGPDGPLGNCWVRLYGPGRDSRDEFQISWARADAHGAFVLGGLGPGTAVLEAHVAGFVQEGGTERGVVDFFGVTREVLARIPASARVDLIAGKTVQRDVRMEPRETLAIIRPRFAGIVVREDGTPAAHADVRVSGAVNRGARDDVGSTLSGPDGSFEVEAEASAGHFAVHAVAPGLRAKPAEFELGVGSEGPRGLRLALRPAPCVRGRVLDISGAPVAGARVTAGSEHFSKVGPRTFWDEQPSVRTAADGSFLLHLAEKQSWGSSADSQGDGIVVCAEAPGFGPGFSHAFTWEHAAAGAPGLQVVLGPGAAIEGRVVDADGHAIADAAITLAKRGGKWNRGEWPPAYPPLPDRVLWTRTGPDGAFRIEHIASASYDVEASREGRAIGTVTVTAPVGGVVIGPGVASPRGGAAGPR